MSLLLTTVGFSQETIQDFEAAGSVFGPFGGATAELVPDPETGGTRGQVAKLTSTGGDVWQGTNVALLKNLDLTTDKTITIDAYSTTPLTFAPKAQGGVAGAPNSVSTATHGGTGWETITVTFNEGLDNTTTANGVYAAFAIHYLWDTTTNNFLSPAVNRVIYVDNIVGVAAADTITPPSTAAPTPTHNAVDVISLFSDAYTDVASNRNPGWGEFVAAETHASNEVLKTTNFIPFAIATPIDITGHTLHVDVWLPQLPSSGAGLLIKILDAANGPHEGNFIYSVANITAGQWNSIDIEITNFNQIQGTWDTTAQGRVDQVLLDIVDDTTMYVDNIYFWKLPTAGLDDNILNSLKMYPNPAKGVVNFSSASNVALDVAVYDMLGKQVLRANAVQSQLNISSLNPGVYFVKMNQGANQPTLISKKLSAMEASFFWFT